MLIRWGPPPANLHLSKTAVHIWRVRLGQPITVLNQLRQHLSADELSRVKRFHFDRDRQRFIVARGALRAILSHYLSQPPDAVRFTYSTHGKPALANDPDPLAFNLSHSGELALVAISRSQPLGIDLEHLRPMPDAAQIARRFFSIRENEMFQTVPAEQRDVAFFNCWTRKEAIIKTIGEGLSHPLDSFDVSLRPGEPAALLAVRGPTTMADAWPLHAFRPAAEYIAAVVTPDREARLFFWQWSLTVSVEQQRE